MHAHLSTCVHARTCTHTHMGWFLQHQLMLLRQPPTDIPPLGLSNVSKKKKQDTLIKREYFQNTGLKKMEFLSVQWNYSDQFKMHRRDLKVRPEASQWLGKMCGKYLRTSAEATGLQQHCKWAQWLRVRIHESKAFLRVCREGSEVKRTGCSSKRPRCVSQFSHSGS